MLQFLEDAYDDKKFPNMSADDRIDASYLRRDYESKPSLIDFIIWQVRFVTHNDMVEVPDS